MTDATAKLSELLSAARGRRMLDDAMGVVRREPSTKTLLSNSFIKASDICTSTASDPDDLDASMRLVRLYASRVKQLPPSLEPTAFNFPPSKPQGDSFIDRGHVGSFRDRFNSPKAGCSFRRERLLRRQSLSSPRPSVSRERSPEPFNSIMRAKYFFSPEPEQILKATSALAETRLTEDGVPARPRSFTIRPSPLLASPPLLPRRLSTGMSGYPPTAGSHRRLPTLLPAVLPASEDAVKTVKTVKTVTARNVAPPASHHSSFAGPRAVPRPRRSSTSDINARRALWLIPDALPPASSSSKRLNVRGGARPF
ncbi:hypothetical protein T484DRAFT_1742711 [Baffinella frigidus]|nr:hypothetical protein T484DRAFT_1742711 [Cryptophyta sp. CCMP2293]